MTNPNIRSAGQTAARFKLSGTVSTGATWWEAYSFSIDGATLIDAETFTWQFNFRSVANESATDLRLSTADGTLTVTQASTSFSITILVPSTSMSALDGDYVADMAYEDGDGNIIHWAHGIVSFRYEPVWVS